MFEKSIRNNSEIRKKAHDNKIYLWEVAAELGITEVHLSRKMRYELPEKEKEKILKCIDGMIAKQERTA